MALNIHKKTLRNVFLVVAGCIVLHWLLNETDRVKSVLLFLRNLIAPFAVGAGFAFILNVPMRGIEMKLSWIKNSMGRRVVAVILTFLAIALVLFLVIWLLLPQLGNTVEALITKLPGFFNRVWEQTMVFLSDNPELMEWINSNTNLEQVNWAQLVEKLVDLIGNSFSKIMSGAFSAIGSVSSGIFNGVVALVFAIYCLFRKEILARQGRRLIYSFLPENVCDEIVRIFRLTSSTFANFISGQCLEALILGCMFAVAMLIFRMPYVPLVSVLVAVTALVPIVGAFVGCALGAFFILVDDPVKAFWFVIMFLVLQQIEGNLIYPRVVGKSVGLRGMWVLLAVAVGGELRGVAGMFIMIPLVSVLYTLLREITNKRLAERGIARVKLNEQPPELRTRMPRKKKKQKPADAPESITSTEGGNNETGSQS